MNNKITLSELAEILSQSGKTLSKKSDWENFLRYFFGEIINALNIDKCVKIKGLGTFKLITVEPRKSVNVKTGETVIIPSHPKISFTPDAKIATIINKPYSHLEVYTLSENGPVDAEEAEDTENDILVENEIEKENVSDSQSNTPIGIATASAKIAEEIESLNNVSIEIENTVSSEKSAQNSNIPLESNSASQEEKEEIEEKETETITPQEPAVEEDCPKEEETQGETIAENDKTELSSEETTTTAEDNISNEGLVLVEENESEEEKKKSKSKKLGLAIIIIVVFLAILAGIVWFSDPDIINKIRIKINENPNVEQQDAVLSVVNEDTVVAPAEIDTVSESIKDSLITSLTEQTETESIEEEEIAYPVKFREDFVEYMAENHPSVKLGAISETEETIKKGEILTVISLKHYGLKDFWVYLYLYNTDIIRNPNKVAPGTKIMIPELDKSLVDANSEECVSLAKEIKARFVEK